MSFKKQDLTDRDFSHQLLVGEVFSHSVLTRANFQNADLAGANFVYSLGRDSDFRDANITHASFEGAAETVLLSLVGARWKGIEITHVSGWIADGIYLAFATNAFVQCGCMQKTFAEWESICRDLDSIQVLHDEQPMIDLVASLAWWKANRDAIARTVQSFTAGE